MTVTTLSATHAVPAGIDAAPADVAAAALTAAAAWATEHDLVLVPAPAVDGIRWDERGAQWLVTLALRTTAADPRPLAA